nr:retrovirus-related Pol polyprotein from transposon TNT 1-94 [Tanacetum cinerariifolium]
IEAARTMLADSKLPTTFWAKAVNTACYVQNRVLVVKPHFKTPYELFKGRSPALSFMRPFGCHIIILNTLDQLGKSDGKSDEWIFDGKSDEGIFVGYSIISIAFRVNNTNTRKVEENLHITFLENKPMIAGGGPEWLFDIDALSKSMNYVLVPADGHNKDKHGPSQASESDKQERPNAESSTKTVNTVGSVNTATPTNADYLSDPLMSDLEDTGIFNDAYDDRDEGAEAGYNNLETMEPKKVTQALDDESWVEAMHEELLQFKLLNDRVYKVEKALYGLHQAPKAWHETLSTNLLDNRLSSKKMAYFSVSPIPSTRIHKDYPKEQIIGEVKSAVQTRKMAKQNEAGLITLVNK